MLNGNEQKPAGLFIRLIKPSDFDKVKSEIVEYIKNKYKGIDLLNISLWRKLGWSGEPVADFLRRYIIIANKLHMTITHSNKQVFLTQLKSSYENLNVDDYNDYIEAFLELKALNLVPDSILKPYTYEPTDTMGTVVKSVNKQFNKILIFGIIGIAVYGLTKNKTVIK